MTASDIVFVCVAGILPLALMAYRLGTRRALASMAGSQTLHSRQAYYGWYTVIAMSLPAIVVALVASVLHLVGLFTVPFPMLLSAVLALGGAGLLFALRLIHPDLRARVIVERVIRWLLIGASTVAILTTIGIVLSVIFEALRFYQAVGFWNFITGTEWAPDTAFIAGAGRSGEAVAEPRFGAVPIFAGTFMITAIAMLVAIPVGLFAAIFLSEYASRRMRNILKPLLEILAGIPTVVYGFFAAITVSPLVVKIAEGLGWQAEATNALTPGLVMGIMIIPFISSLSDDVISAVPQTMRDGSLALGTTQSEMIKHVLLPAALPGIVSAVLLAVSRAIGETMIVVMAAGLRPNLTWNPLEGMTTVTVRIVDALTGDQEFDSLLTLSAFGLGFVLLIITLILNIVSIAVIRRFRQRYE